MFFFLFRSSVTYTDLKENLFGFDFGNSKKVSILLILQTVIVLIIHGLLSPAFRMVFYDLTVPNSYCGRVIGKGGKKINLITVRFLLISPSFELM